MSSAEDNKLAEEIGKRIAAFRHACRFSQTTLAKQVGIRQAPLSNLEQGKCLPSTRVLMKLAEALGVSVDDILGIRGAGDMGAALICVCGDVGTREVAVASLSTRYAARSWLPSYSFELAMTEAELVAQTLRRSLGCEHVVRLDVVEHLKWEGVAVGEAETTALCSVYCGEGGAACLVLKRGLSEENRRFAAAYGLARLMIAARDAALHEKWETLQNQKDRLANAVASAFLMPNELISRYIMKNGTPSSNDISEMSRFFGVSEDQLKSRLSAVGVVVI